MKVLIIYFSGTGNTELIAKEIIWRLQNKGHITELVSIEDRIKMASLTFEDKIIGFGFPVYKLSYAENFEPYFSQFNLEAQNNRYFMFSTYARLNANSFYDFSQKLDPKHFKRITQKSFKAPSCGISGRLEVTDFDYENVMFFEDDIATTLDQFVEEICSLENKQTMETMTKPKWISPFIKQLIQKIEITKYPKLQIEQDKCILCGKCSRECPEENLIKGTDHIEILDEFGCLHCLRCMNHCPVNAINFGKLTRHDNQYTLKTRDTLFARAKSGHNEKYWQDFDKITMEWRKKTFKYYLKHKHNPEL